MAAEITIDIVSETITIDAGAGSSAAQGYAAAAAADAVSTAADVVLTNADVVTTNADVVLTNADVVLTNADVVSTNADAASTAADAISTAADAASTAADVISTNADVVSTAADVIAAAASAAAAGGNGIYYQFATSTVMGDPGAGLLRLDDADPSAATALAFDATSAATGNPDVSDFIATWDDSTNTIKGHILLSKIGSPEKWVVFAVTAVTDNTGWLEVTATYVDHAGTFSASDNLTVQFTRTGDKGADGAGTGDVVGPASSTDDVLAVFDGTTGKLLKNGTAGVTVAAVQANTAKVTNATHTGDVTGATALTIADDAVTYAKMQNVTATARVLGRNTAGAGVVEEITEAQFKALFNLEAGTDFEAVDADILRADTDDTLTAGFAATGSSDGTQSSGTYTPAAAGGNYKEIVNGGGFALAPMTLEGNVTIEMTNNGSAGTVTTSGFDIVTGDDLTTTDTHIFLLYLTVIDASSHLHITALQ